MSSYRILLSAAISRDTVPSDFSLTGNTILPIPKTKNASITSSDNFHRVALSSIFVKLFDNIVIHGFYEKFCTSELQFGFKSNSSTHVYCDFKRNAVILYSSQQFCLLYIVQRRRTRL